MMSNKKTEFNSQWIREFHLLWTKQKFGKLISEFYDPNLVKPGDFFTDFGMARVSLILKIICILLIYLASGSAII